MTSLEGLFLFLSKGSEIFDRCIHIYRSNIRILYTYERILRKECEGKLYSIQISQIDKSEVGSIESYFLHAIISDFREETCNA